MSIHRLIGFVLAAVLALLGPGAGVLAQETFGPPREGVPRSPGLAPGVQPGLAGPPAGLSGSPKDLTTGEMNPLSVLANAGAALPGGDGTQAKGLSTALNVVVVLTVITLVPSIILMCTCFLRIIVVLGLLKQALGTQQMPPSQVVTGLALAMTLLVMSPVIERINREAVAPYRAGQITSYDDLWKRARQPLRDFMFDQIDAAGNHTSLLMILNYRGVDTSRPERLTRESVDMVCLVPAFVLSELKVAFLMGFKVYLPFLVIDMVISSLLISMSMMMLPPVLISLPFKLLLFVMVDGWQLVVGGLMSSFVHGPPGGAPGGSGGVDPGGAGASAVSMVWPAVEPVVRAVWG